MEDPLEDSEILHSGEGGDVEQTSEQISLCLRLFVTCSLLFFIFHTCMIIHLTFYNCFHSITFITGLYSSHQGGN